MTEKRSLPHRQLRNDYDEVTSKYNCSLPHRQLRNIDFLTQRLPDPFTAAQAA